ncbi:EAL domain-containing protein [Arthrobacter agilis]|uniref:putative bifunctional diguanylate cyclase/phosphodiesterase n=1 Tax=Arthrobacter agilis TaxID=37921 RepID=UPI0023653AEA|nr:EAL domain-containing protein [Arthrobacter agilis]WDF33347.1 EAL domain-containing protein [Arthrobacter agilis]
MRRSVARAAAGHPSGRTRRPPFVDVLLVVMVLLLTAYTVGLALGDHGTFDPLVDGWLSIFTELAAVTLCISACVRSRLAEPQVVLGTLAVGTYAAGDAYYASSLDGADALVAMSLADVAYLAFYPLMLGTLAVVVVRRPKALVWPLLVDSLVGALGAASLMALILAPVLHLGAQSGSYEVIVAVVYPLLDLLLISAVAGILATRGLDVGPRWPLLIAGLLVFSVADVGYALGMQDYAVGSIVDAGWVAGIVAIAAWVDGAADTRGALHGRSHAVPELAAPLVSTAVALVVLLVGTQMSIPVLAVVFAGATLALAALPLTSRNRMLITLARTDELTGLPNRRAFLTDVPARLSRETTGALFLLDLDRFKHVNDALGHDVGDELLVHVGERFARHIRPNDMLARLGGDEFAVFLAGVSEEQAVAAAQRLAEELADPVEVASATLLVSASVGIALVPAHGTDMGLLMRKADIAMFRAKAEHRGHHVYDASDDNDGALRLRTVQELRTALAEDQFEMHYQPKVRLVDQEVTGVEALVRWNHPTRGQLPPAAFLALAEEAGLMPELSSLVLRRAIRRAARWRSEGLDISVAVNMSGSCILSCLPYEIHQLLRTHSLPPSRLVLEITEDVLMSTPVGTARILEDLRVSGIRISIDDFGTGYSSLAYLRDLPVDELKLDRSFITAMPHDVRARGLVGSIIDLAHSLGLEVVAEGVNDEGTRDDLLAQGCDSAQGFLFSRPLPAREISSWVSGRVGSGGGSCR